MKKSRLLGTVCMIALIWSVSAATNASIIYNINRTVGAGSVTGTIETDSTIGAIDSSNILSWSLNLFDGVDAGTITSSSNVFSGLSATPTELLYDFNQIGGHSEFGPLPVVLTETWHYRLSAGEEELRHELDDAFTVHNIILVQSGIQVIGTVSTVPVPAAVWLFGSGLLGLVGMARRKAA